MLVVGFILRLAVSRMVVGAVAKRYGIGFFGKAFGTIGLSRALKTLFRDVKREESALTIGQDVFNVAASTVPLGARATVEVFGVNAFVSTLRAYERAVVGNTMLTDINRLLVFKVLTGVVTRTPVDTGTARASWFAERADGGQPKGSTVTTLDVGKRAAGAIALLSLKTIPFGPDGTYWVTNNQPYIEALEFGLYKGSGPKTVGGFSRQAPQGMVRITLAEINAEVDNDMRKIIRLEESKVQRVARRT